MYKSQLMIFLEFGFALYTFDQQFGMWHDHIILLMHQKGFDLPQNNFGLSNGSYTAFFDVLNWNTFL